MSWARVNKLSLRAITVRRLPDLSRFRSAWMRSRLSPNQLFSFRSRSARSRLHCLMKKKKNLKISKLLLKFGTNYVRKKPANARWQFWEVLAAKSLLKITASGCLRLILNSAFHFSPRAKITRPQMTPNSDQIPSLTWPQMKLSLSLKRFRIVNKQIWCAERVLNNNLTLDQPTCRATY